jgi:hypothetical protein
MDIEINKYFVGNFSSCIGKRRKLYEQYLMRSKILNLNNLNVFLFEIKKVIQS